LEVKGSKDLVINQLVMKYLRVHFEMFKKSKFNGLHYNNIKHLHRLFLMIKDLELDIFDAF